LAFEFLLFHFNAILETKFIVKTLRHAQSGIDKSDFNST